MTRPIQTTLLAILLSIVTPLIIASGCWALKGVSAAENNDNTALSNPLKLLKREQPYRFTAMGDWGAGTPFQKAVAKQLIRLYQKTPFDAIVLLGDNIYPDGNIRKYAKAYFEDMYSELLANNVNFIVALGNHDEVKGYQRDQIQFFHMPGYYYLVNKPHTQFFIIDSNTFATDQVQQQWLKQALAKSKSIWKIVVGHHPIYSSGEHGLNTGLKKTLEPILTQNKVDFYLAGHDHEYERFAPIQGVHYIVSGGGGAYLRDFEKVLPHSLVRKKAHHFLSFKVSSDQLSMQVIDSEGALLDALTVQKAAQAAGKSAIRMQQ